MIALTIALASQMIVRQLKSEVVVDNGRLSVAVSRSTGRFTVRFGAMASIEDAFGETRLAGGAVRKTFGAKSHEVGTSRLHDAFGDGVRIIIRNRYPDSLELRQILSIYEGKPEILVGLDLIDPSGKGTNRMTALATDSPVKLVHAWPLNSLFVPYDNDNYVRYRSDGWNEPVGSFEVGVLYSDQSGGLVIGSIDHTQWKSGVKFLKDGGVSAVAGVTGKDTRDVEPHGTVVGNVVSSPRFVVGLYDDWRAGLERYGDLNAIVQPPLHWGGSVPFGWSSWSGHKSKITDQAAEKAIDVLRDDLPWLRSGGVAFVNLDAFWDNLTRDQRIAFCKKAHASGLKAGIYWTPFVNWGEPDWKAVGNYIFKDLQLKNEKGELLPKLDGGWPLDPTHPGTLLRIDENLKDFIEQGFDYIKLDFLTHGSLEGHHFDPKVTTGTEAYRIGMRRVLDGLSLKKAGRPIFISLSIAPMFPQGFGHSRRISCDIFSNIGASEYFLNSQNYGWWTAGRLYQYNDPDSACEYQALGEKSTTPAEARTRFTASVIGGGMMIEGDDLTKPAAHQRVLEMFSNKSALALAETTPRFRPVHGNTGDKAGDTFVYEDRAGNYVVAAFNFDKKLTRTTKLAFKELGIPTGHWVADDMWSGKQWKVRNELDLRLPPTDCALIRLTRSK